MTTVQKRPQQDNKLKESMETVAKAMAFARRFSDNILRGQETDQDITLALACNGERDLEKIDLLKIIDGKPFQAAWKDLVANETKVRKQRKGASKTLKPLFTALRHSPENMGNVLENARQIAVLIDHLKTSDVDQALSATYESLAGAQPGFHLEKIRQNYEEVSARETIPVEPFSAVNSKDSDSVFLEKHFSDLEAAADLFGGVLLDVDRVRGELKTWFRDTGKINVTFISNLYLLERYEAPNFCQARTLLEGSFYTLKAMATANDQEKPAKDVSESYSRIYLYDRLRKVDTPDDMDAFCKELDEKINFLRKVYEDPEWGKNQITGELAAKQQELAEDLEPILENIRIVAPVIRKVYDARERIISACADGADVTRKFSGLEDNNYYRLISDPAVKSAIKALQDPAVNMAEVIRLGYDAGLARDDSALWSFVQSIEDYRVRVNGSQDSKQERLKNLRKVKPLNRFFNDLFMQAKFVELSKHLSPLHAMQNLKNARIEAEQIKRTEYLPGQLMVLALARFERRHGAIKAQVFPMPQQSEKISSKVFHGPAIPEEFKTKIVDLLEVAKWGDGDEMLSHKTIRAKEPEAREPEYRWHRILSLFSEIGITGEHIKRIYRSDDAHVIDLQTDAGRAQILIADYKEIFVMRDENFTQQDLPLHRSPDNITQNDESIYFLIERPDVWKFSLIDDEYTKLSLQKYVLTPAEYLPPQGKHKVSWPNKGSASEQTLAETVIRTGQHLHKSDTAPFQFGRLSDPRYSRDASPVRLDSALRRNSIAKFQDNREIVSISTLWNDMVKREPALKYFVNAEPVTDALIVRDCQTIMNTFGLAVSNDLLTDLEDEGVTIAGQKPSTLAAAFRFAGLPDLETIQINAGIAARDDKGYLVPAVQS